MSVYFSAHLSAVPVARSNCSRCAGWLVNCCDAGGDFLQRSVTEAALSSCQPGAVGTHFGVPVGISIMGAGRTMLRQQLSGAPLLSSTSALIWVCVLCACAQSRVLALGDKQVATEFVELPCQVLFADVERVGGEWRRAWSSERGRKCGMICGSVWGREVGGWVGNAGGGAKCVKDVCSWPTGIVVEWFWWLQSSQQ